MTHPWSSEEPADPARHLVIRVLGADQLAAATELLAEGMRDNPLHVKAFGGDAPLRQRRLQRFLGQLVTHIHANGTLLGASVDGELVGVQGMLKPGHCRPAAGGLLRMVATIIASNSPLGVWRIQRWLLTWARRDPREPHAHIGPLAVASSWRGQGVGRSLMTEACHYADTLGAVAWLETDLAANVAFYETLGYVVVRCELVLGVLSWYMQREPMRVGK